VDLSLISENAWLIASRRAEVIRPLALMAQCPKALVKSAAEKLELSERHIYTLIGQCRTADNAASETNFREVAR